MPLRNQKKVQEKNMLTNNCAIYKKGLICYKGISLWFHLKDACFLTCEHYFSYNVVQIKWNAMWKSLVYELECRKCSIYYRWYMRSIMIYKLDYAACCEFPCIRETRKCKKKKKIQSKKLICLRNDTANQPIIENWNSDLSHAR